MSRQTKEAKEHSTAWKINEILKEMSLWIAKLKKVREAY